MRLSEICPIQKRAGRVAQVEEGLSGHHEVLSSSPSTDKKSEGEINTFSDKQKLKNLLLVDLYCNKCQKKFLWQKENNDY
jgi:hypothetical protein